MLVDVTWHRRKCHHHHHRYTKTAPSPLTSAATARAREQNGPRAPQLLATVAMCNIVELHLALALQTRMTNPSRSALKALGEASGAARRPPVTLSWMFPHYFIMYSRLCFHGARPGLVMGGSSELFQSMRARHNLHFILLTKKQAARASGGASPRLTRLRRARRRQISCHVTTG